MQTIDQIILTRCKTIFMVCIFNTIIMQEYALLKSISFFNSSYYILTIFIPTFITTTTKILHRGTNKNYVRSLLEI